MMKSESKGRSGKRMNLTVDSSIFVSALRKDEEKHAKSLALFRKIKDGEHIAIEPYSVLVKVVAAIRRRTDDMALAKRVKDDFLNIDTLNFVEIGDVLAEGAAEIAAKIGVRGMDALIIQTAKEYNDSLVSFDDEMAERAKEVVKIADIEKLI